MKVVGVGYSWSSPRMHILWLNDKHNKFILKATGVILIFFSAKGSQTSSFNDGTKLKNSGPTLSATTSIIFSCSSGDLS